MAKTIPYATRYDRKTVVLHWATAILVVLLWGIAQIIDVFPSGAPRIDVRSVHITLGVILGIVLLIRVPWRLTGGTKLPPADTGVLQLAATLVHYLLYALVIIEVLLGLTNAYVRGDSLYTLVSLPGYRPWRHEVGSLHGTVATIILIVAGVHAAAALGHHYILKDGVLRRMLPDRWGG
jgi:cytochrome b561